MKITKFGHSCLLVEEKGARILIDPGSWNEIPELSNLHALIITHEHPDHFNLETIKKLTLKNPDIMPVFSTKSVCEKLDASYIRSIPVESDYSVIIREDIQIDLLISLHEPIYRELFPRVDNLGVLIADKFFHPGDSFLKPNVEVEILALPVIAPWMNITQGLDFVKGIKPKVCFPIHDGMLKIFDPWHMIPSKVLAADEIIYKVLELGIEEEF